MSINKTFLAGNLSRDPETSTTTSGTTVLTFGVAVNDRKKNEQGVWEDYAHFIDCVMFGKRAEGLSKVLTKGMKVAIEGSLRQSRWEKDGQQRSKLEVAIDEIELLSQREESKPKPKPQQQTQQQTQQPQATQGEIYDEDIPF